MIRHRKIHGIILTKVYFTCAGNKFSFEEMFISKNVKRKKQEPFPKTFQNKKIIIIKRK